MNIALFPHSFVQRVLCIIIANRALWREKRKRYDCSSVCAMGGPYSDTVVHKPRYSLDDCGKGEIWSNNRLVYLARVQLQCLVHKIHTQWKWYISIMYECISSSAKKYECIAFVQLWKIHFVENRWKLLKVPLKASNVKNVQNRLEQLSRTSVR